MTVKKLVRDNIPEIIEGTGHVPVVRTLDDKEYAEELRRKLMEEVAEYIDEPSTEELADILEVVYALGALHDASSDDLEVVRKSKAEKRGAFSKRIYLVSIEEV